MKKIFLTFITFVIYFNSFTLAHASVGGWTMSNPIASGASTIYNGAKTVIINGANAVKNGTAKITPTAANVSKVLARGGATIALTFAVEQLLGSVDWVLDPANNQIKYWDEPGNPYYLGVVGSDVFGEGKTREEACQMYAVSYNKKFGGGSTLYYYSTVGVKGDVTPTSTYWCYLSKMVYSTVSPNAVRVEGNINVEELGNTDGEVKTYPLLPIADYLIKKAEQGNTTAQVATMAAAADIVKEAETDQAKAAPIVQQLENSAVTETDETATGTQTKNPTNPDVTDLSIEFPAFCGWAPMVCEAAQTVISFPKTLTNWWDTATSSISEAWAFAKDWATSDTKSETDTEVDIEQDDAPQLDTNIFNASGECPPDFSYPFPLPLGGTYTITYSYATACYWFSKLYYIVVTVASLISIRIVSGTEGKSNG